ncbi:hypothetical protein RUM43_004098 [Polyplax serrata]|uniref:Uncharacterized protein n=1 Tax=Polyplax serrata TaxID=468196 RepID=A0AAN8XMM9_POLSC
MEKLAGLRYTYGIFDYGNSVNYNHKNSYVNDDCNGVYRYHQNNSSKYRHGNTYYQPQNAFYPQKSWKNPKTYAESLEKKTIL